MGGGYDINRHCFVCDIKGLYSFYAALASANDTTNFKFYMNVTLCAKDTHEAMIRAPKKAGKNRCFFLFSLMGFPKSLVVFYFR